MNKKISTSLIASLLLSTNIYANDTVQLDEITVTSATKSTQSIKDVTSNIDVITKEEIEERNFTTVSEALNTLGGINVISNGGLGSTTTVSLRGMENEKTLILIDGVRYQDPSNTSGASLSHLMINNIERIEVIKGAQSGIWGADASAGVINIITQKAKKGTSGTLNFEAGSFNTRKYGATVSHGIDKFDFRLSANKIETDGFSNQSPRGSNVEDFEKDGYENTTLSLDTNYYISDSSTLSFNVKDINGLAEYDGGPFSYTDEQKANNNSFESDIDTTLYNIAFNQKISNHNMKIKYELSKFKRHEIGTTASFFGENVLKFDGKSQNIEVSDEIKYIEDGFLILGVGATEDNVDYLLTDDSTNDKNSKSKYVYITNSNKFDKLIFTQSLRYDKYSNYDNEFTGKVGLKYNFNKDFEVSTNIGTAYNVPSIIKQLNPWNTSGTNFELEPEKTKSFDIGFKYKDLSATYFKSKIDNLINWSSTGYENVEGESTFKGIELGYKRSINEDTLVSLNYTHLSAVDDDGEDLKRRAKRQLGFGIDYYGFDKLHLNANGSYIGTRYNSDDKGGTSTGNYTLWNAVANYKINKTFSTYLKVDNLFNKYYQTIDGYATAERSAYVGLKATF